MKEVYFDDFKVEHVKSPVISSQDYYPFGLSFNSYQRENALTNQYQYNGKEMQDELVLGMSDYGDRFYDASISRFTTLDKRAHNYMMYSPYGYVVNNPVNNVDINGQFILPKEFLQKYSSLANYLQNGIQGILDNKRIVGALKEFGGFSDDQLKEAFTWGKGPIVQIGNAPGDGMTTLGYSGGKKGETFMGINIDLVEALESAKGKDKEYLLFITAVAILHEYVHNGVVENEINVLHEEGNEFERKAYGEVLRYSTGNYKAILDKWLNEQKKKQEDGRKKGQALNRMLSNFSSLQSGTYTWNGSQFVQGGKETPEPEKENEN